MMSNCLNEHLVLKLQLLLFSLMDKFVCFFLSFFLFVHHATMLGTESLDGAYKH